LQNYLPDSVCLKLLRRKR